MAKMNFGGVEETVVTREEFPIEKAREVLKNETIAIIGYGVQGPGQSLNLRDNGFNVIIGQRPGKTFDKAINDGWIPGETLFSIEEACARASIIMCLLSDAAVLQQWPVIKQNLNPGKALYCGSLCRVGPRLGTQRGTGLPADPHHGRCRQHTHHQ